MIKFTNFNFKYTKSENLNLNNINLEIHKGECVLLTGNSGCGKTSILRIINGLSPEYFDGGFNGVARIAHLQIGDNLQEFSKVVGSVFQNPKNQFFHLDSTSELAFSMENLGFPPEEIVERINFLAKTFSAEELLDRNILELSGGEKQKLAFMASMMLDADIFVLDEITSNLDLQAIKLISEIIEKLKSNGKTIIIAEHRIYYLRDIIDRMYIISNGQVIHSFTSKDLLLFDGTQCRTRQLDLTKVQLLEKPKRTERDDYLKFNNLEYKVNKNKVCHKNQNFSTGKVYAIIGKNGCGKTTFANVLSGFWKYKGDVILNNKKLNKKELIKNSFQVMQDVNYQLFTNSVEKEIKLGCSNLDKFEEVIGKLKLTNLLLRHPNTLSGGEKQRVAIASALLSNKKILIFDEPTSGLDYSNMIELSKLITEISNKEIIVFVITHDYEFLCSVADEVVHFDTHGIKERIEVTENNKNYILEVMN